MMIKPVLLLLPLAITLGACVQPANDALPPVSSIDFGDDSSEWSNDGECDDPRFKGPGMTATPLLAEDIKADATDCRDAYVKGLLYVR